MLMRTRWATPKRQLPPGFIRPCQPVLSLKVPVGDGWNPRALAACLYMPSTSCTSAITTLRRLELVEPHQHSATYSAPAQAALPSRCCATNEPATQPKKPPKSAGVSDWKKYTPASHTADQTPPRARRTSRQRAHVSSGTYGALSPRRQPSSPFRASSVLFFGGDLPLSWRIGRDRPPVR